MPRSPLQLPLDGLPDEVRPALVLGQRLVDTGQSSFGEPAGGLLVVDLLSSHVPKIDDITNCYKGYFCGYHLLTDTKLVISSNHQNGRRT